jgi:hypothetical protein
MPSPGNLINFNLNVSGDWYENISGTGGQIFQPIKCNHQPLNIKIPVELTNRVKRTDSSGIS